MPAPADLDAFLAQHDAGVGGGQASGSDLDAFLAHHDAAAAPASGGGGLWQELKDNISSGVNPLTHVALGVGSVLKDAAVGAAKEIGKVSGLDLNPKIRYESHGQPTGNVLERINYDPNATNPVQQAGGYAGDVAAFMAGVEALDALPLVAAGKAAASPLVRAGTRMTANALLGGGLQAAKDKSLDNVLPAAAAGALLPEAARGAGRALRFTTTKVPEALADASRGFTKENALKSFDTGEVVDPTRVQLKYDIAGTPAEMHAQAQAVLHKLGSMKDALRGVPDVDMQAVLGEIDGAITKAGTAGDNALIKQLQKFRSDITDRRVLMGGPQAGGSASLGPRSNLTAYEADQLKSQVYQDAERAFRSGSKRAGAKSEAAATAGSALRAGVEDVAPGVRPVNADYESARRLVEELRQKVAESRPETAAMLSGNKTEWRSLTRLLMDHPQIYSRVARFLYSGERGLPPEIAQLLGPGAPVTLPPTGGGTINQQEATGIGPGLGRPSPGSVAKVTSSPGGMAQQVQAAGLQGSPMTTMPDGTVMLTPRLRGLLTSGAHEPPPAPGTAAPQVWDGQTGGQLQPPQEPLVPAAENLTVAHDPRFADTNAYLPAEAPNRMENMPGRQGRLGSETTPPVPTQAPAPAQGKTMKYAGKTFHVDAGGNIITPADADMSPHERGLLDHAISEELSNVEATLTHQESLTAQGKDVFGNMRGKGEVLDAQGREVRPGETAPREPNALKDSPLGKVRVRGGGSGLARIQAMREALKKPGSALHQAMRAAIRQSSTFSDIVDQVPNPDAPGDAVDTGGAADTSFDPTALESTPTTAPMLTLSPQTADHPAHQIPLGAATAMTPELLAQMRSRLTVGELLRSLRLR